MGKKSKETISDLKEQIAILEKQNQDVLEQSTEIHREYVQLYSLLKEVSSRDCPAIEKAKIFMNNHQSLEDYQ